MGRKLYAVILLSTLVLNAGGKSTQRATTEPIEIPTAKSGAFYIRGGFGRVSIKDRSAQENLTALYLSGGAYSSPPHDVMLKECNSDVKKYLKDLK